MKDDGCAFCGRQSGIFYTFEEHFKVCNHCFDKLDDDFIDGWNEFQEYLERKKVDFGPPELFVNYRREEY